MTFIYSFIILFDSIYYVQKINDNYIKKGEKEFHWDVPENSCREGWICPGFLESAKLSLARGTCFEDLTAFARESKSTRRRVLSFIRKLRSSRERCCALCGARTARN